MAPMSESVVSHPLWSSPVTLTGLTGRVDLNGASGIVVFFSRGRLHVLLSSSLPPHAANPKIVLVKPDNVAPLPPAPPVRAPPTHRCAGCGAAALHACGRCLSAYYCSAACQRECWGGWHKAACRAGVALALERLHPASHAGDVAGVLAALDAGAAVNAPAPQHGEYTALHFAVAGRHAEVVEALVERGAHLDTRTRAGTQGGSTPLMEAAPRRATRCAHALVRAGANVRLGNRNAWTALHFAASERNLELAQLLLAHGAEVNAVNNEGDSVRFVFEMRALASPHPDTGAVRALLHAHGAVCLSDGKVQEVGADNGW